MLSSSFGNPLLSDVSVHSVTRLLRRTRDIACSVQNDCPSLTFTVIAVSTLHSGSFSARPRHPEREEFA